MKIKGPLKTEHIQSNWEEIQENTASKLREDK